MSILSKDKIKKYIPPFVPVAKGGKKLTQAQQISLVEAMLYRLKTGCQWRELPMKELFCQPYSLKTVFYHFNSWSKAGCWQKIWIHLLAEHGRKIDMSCIQLDGSQTRCYKARQQVGYQKRRADQTTNLLFLSDNQGILLSVCQPISGQHHDLFNIEFHFEQLLSLLEQAGIAIEGLFLNADAGFDSQALRKLCAEKGIIANIAFNPGTTHSWDRQAYFDPYLYTRRVVIERAFAHLDACKALLIRYELTALNWINLNLLAMTCLFLPKI